MAKEMIAMILAGGQGSRLYALTQKLAKPAVPFGGKYRIIDFPLSNCVNSDIDTVGILTQYQPLVLNEYIGNGQPWDLDRLHGGVHVLPPYQQASGSDWYKGTANAIYQNLSFIDRYDPKYVIILSGDQICKQDYSDFLRFHKEKNAEFSVAVMEVPWSEASRFGLMVTDEDDRINEFQEKPKNPKSNLASMGIYIFNWDILKKYLTEDEADPNSENDFGKNVIPNLLKDGRRMYAYHFSGYWKDVGTIGSLWQANMEVLDPSIPASTCSMKTGRSIPATPVVPASRSAVTPPSSTPWYPRAARSTARSITPSCSPAPLWKRVPPWRQPLLWAALSSRRVHPSSTALWRRMSRSRRAPPSVPCRRAA